MTARELSLSNPNLFDTTPDARFDKVTALAVRFLNAPASRLTVIDDLGDRQLFKSMAGPATCVSEARSTPLIYSFCKHVRDSGQPLIVTDARTHPLLRDNPAIPEFGVLSYIGVPFHGEDGDPVGALCCLHFSPNEWTADDIDVLTKLAEVADDQVQYYVAIRDRVRAKIAAERASRTRASFLAHANHEVRTPLGNISGAARLLNLQPLDDRAGTLAELIERNSSRLQSLLSDMIQVASLDAGAVSISEDMYNIAEVVDSVVDSYRETASEKDLELRLENNLTFDATFMLDKKNLNEVLHRLISNAIKFTDAGTVTVSLEEEPPNSIAVKVTDTGIGIEADQQIVLFEEFEGHDPRTARKGGGSGLGMNIVRRRVELMGGSISVESQHGMGTTFTLRLPHGSDVLVESTHT